ncbi:RICIN domain-containing protein [Streptomyces sp. NPDC005827]|uniref:RICIN domain-containing protein n=1 Tax=Streptomyces sp. NPDC005827 TaxID=3157070 RepID=UPI0033CA3517
MRNSLKGALVAAVTVLASIAVVSPAQSATYPSYANKKYGECLTGRSTDGNVLWTESCDGSSQQDWEVESRPQTGTSNDVVKLRNVRYNRCLDSGAGVNNDPVTNNSCNTGNYQLWEVFYNTNGTRTFKSWGAWKNQGLHLCLSSDPASRDYPVLIRTCDRNSAVQQWTRRT